MVPSSTSVVKIPDKSPLIPRPMSQNWTRGSRCNVDNCRTHYYKIIDGQRICQYGHVYEGHVEFNDEEDENYVVTRRLNIPGQSQGISQGSQINPSLAHDENKRRLYGYAGRELYFKCFQCILRSQVKCIIKESCISEVLETTVKRFWVEYLTHALDENLSTDGGNTNQVDDIIENYDSLTTTDGSEINYRFNKIPPLIDTLAIIYVSFRYLRLPLYTNDLVLWATVSKIPYMKAGYEVPKKLRQRLSTILLSKMEPKRPPIKGELDLAIIRIVTKLGLNDTLPFNYHPLLMKLTNELILPPRIYQATKNLIQHLEIDFKFPKFTEKLYTRLNTSDFMKAIREFPELVLVSCLIIATKLFFLKPTWVSKKVAPNWKDWRQILQSLSMNRDDNRNFNNLLTSLITSDKADSELLEWDAKKTEKYLDWFEGTFIDNKTLKDPDYSISLKRLHKIFDLEKGETSRDLTEELHNTESAYKQLFENQLSLDGQEPEPLTNDELLQIEETLVENLNLNFGVTIPQLKSCLHDMESKLMKSL